MFKKKYLFFFFLLTLFLIRLTFYHISGDEGSYYIFDSNKIKISRDELVEIKRNLRDQNGGFKRMNSLVSSLSAPLPNEWIDSTPAKILNTCSKQSYNNIVSLLDSSGNIFSLHYDIFKSNEDPESGFVIVNYSKSEKLE